MFTLKSITDYESFFYELDKHLRIRKIVLLHGDLGAGKTTCVKEYLKYKYNISEERLVKEGFSSPTFTIENQYELSSDLVLHFDFYRIENGEYDIEDHIDEIKKASAVFVEWPEKILLSETLSRSDYFEVYFKVSDNGVRQIKIL